jgi:hypothetical protein
MAKQPSYLRGLASRLASPAAMVTPPRHLGFPQARGGSWPRHGIALDSSEEPATPAAMPSPTHGGPDRSPEEHRTTIRQTAAGGEAVATGTDAPRGQAATTGLMGDTDRHRPKLPDEQLTLSPENRSGAAVQRGGTTAGRLPPRDFVAPVGRLPGTARIRGSSGPSTDSIGATRVPADQVPAAPAPQPGSLRVAPDRSPHATAAPPQQTQHARHSRPAGSTARMLTAAPEGSRLARGSSEQPIRTALLNPRPVHTPSLRVQGTEPRQEPKPSLRIGSIEVVVTPPPPVPRATPQAAQHGSSLSRGFATTFGLKQG